MAAGDRFRGVYPMLYALFDERGELDRTAMRAQVELQSSYRTATFGAGTSPSAAKVGDLDGDGNVELLSSLDTLEPKTDAVLAHSWQPGGALIEKLRVPVPAGVRAIAVCPFEASGGITPIAIGTAEGLWLVR